MGPIQAQSEIVTRMGDREFELYHSGHFFAPKRQQTRGTWGAGANPAFLRVDHWQLTRESAHLGPDDVTTRLGQPVRFSAALGLECGRRNRLLLSPCQKHPCKANSRGEQHEQIVFTFIVSNRQKGRCRREKHLYSQTSTVSTRRLAFIRESFQPHKILNRWCANLNLWTEVMTEPHHLISTPHRRAAKHRCPYQYGMF